MTDDLENELRRFRPVGPPPELRDRILRRPAPAQLAARRWLGWIYRASVAASLLLSFTLFRAADALNRDSAARVGMGPPRWTPEADQAADLLGGDPSARQYIALCLIAGNAPRPPANPTQGGIQ